MRYGYLAAATFAALLSAAPVIAADMPTKAPAYYAPAYNWTGGYVGGNIGWGWYKGDGTLTIGGAAGPYSGTGNGFLGGVQIGYNYQTGVWVWGLEADFQGSAARGTVTGSAGATTLTGTAKVPWFSTLRGRIGYASNTWLFYFTGGAVYGRATLDGVLSTTGAFSSSSSYWTWTIGGGVETALWPRWTGKLEYLYADTPSKAPVPPGTSAVSGHGDTHVLRVGLNYRF